MIGIDLMWESHNNVLDSNLMCNNPEDIKEMPQATNNNGSLNTCDVSNGWNDNGTTGCTYGCTYGC